MDNDRHSIKAIIEKLEQEDCSLSVIALNGCSVTDSDIGEIAALLPNATKLKSIDLSRNDITDKGICLLINGLKSLETVETLLLQDNKIESEGITLISEFVRDHNTLKELNISGTKLTCKMFCYFVSQIISNSNLSLSSLNVSNNLLTDDSSESIISLLNELQLNSLSLQNCRLSDLFAKTLTTFLCHFLPEQKILIDISNNNFEDSLYEDMMLEANNHLSKLTLLAPNHHYLVDNDGDCIMEEPKVDTEVGSIPIEGNINYRHSSLDISAVNDDLPSNYKTVAQKLIYILFSTKLYEQLNLKLVNIPANIIDRNTSISPMASSEQQSIYEYSDYGFFLTPNLNEETNIDLDQLNSLNTRMSPHQISSCLKLSTQFIEDSLKNKDTKNSSDLEAILRVYADNIDILIAVLKESQHLESNENSFPLEDTIPSVNQSTVKRFGIIRAGVLELIIYLLKYTYTVNANFHFDTIIIEKQINDIIFNLFFEYPWNNTLHYYTLNYFNMLLDTPSLSSLVDDLFGRYKLLDKLIEATLDVVDGKQNNISKNGKFEFLYEMLKKVRDCINKDAQSPLSTYVDALTCDWNAFLNTYINSHEVTETTQIGGAKPKKIDYITDSFLSQFRFEPAGNYNDDNDDDDDNTGYNEIY